MAIGFGQPLTAQPLNPAMEPFPWESWDEFRRRMFYEQQNQLERQSQNEQRLMGMRSQMAQDKAQMDAARARHRGDMQIGEARNQMQLSDLQLSMAFDRLRDKEPVGSVTRSFRNTLGSY